MRVGAKGRHLCALQALRIYRCTMYVNNWHLALLVEHVFYGFWGEKYDFQTQILQLKWKNAESLQAQFPKCALADSLESIKGFKLPNLLFSFLLISCGMQKETAAFLLLKRRPCVHLQNFCESCLRAVRSLACLPRQTRQLLSQGSQFKWFPLCF